MTGLTEEIRILKSNMYALSFKFVMSTVLRLAISRDFKSLNQDGAYDILIYLLNVCHEKNVFKIMEQSDWKKRDTYSRMDIEKLKKDILVAVKDISMKIKHIYNIPVLKKTDLMVPYCQKFFKCCKGLSSYDVSFQLSRLEKTCWPLRPEIHLAWFTEVIAVRAEEIKALILEEEKCLEEEKKLYSTAEEDLKKQIIALESELKNYADQKTYVQACLDNLIDNCEFIDKDALRNKNLRSAAIVAAHKQIDDLAAENCQRLDSLKALDENLSFLQNTLENPPERTVIDGKELATHISYESRTFAEKENINLFLNGDLNLHGLLELAVKSFQSCSENSVGLPQNLLKILEIKLPSYDPELLHNLKIIKNKLNEELADLKHKLVQNVDECAVRKLAEDFMTPIPSINFDLNDQIHWIRKDPIVDVKKIEFFIHGKKIESKKGTNTSATVMSLSNHPGSFNLRHNTVRRSSSSSMLYSEDSPISTVKMQYTRVRRRRELRRSISSANLLSTPKTANESTSTTVQDADKHFSSTHKADLFFEGDKSISPICVGSYNYPSRLFEEMEHKNQSSAAFTVSFNNISPHHSFVLSYTTSENESRNTFDSSRSTSLPDLSEASLISNENIC